MELTETQKDLLELVGAVGRGSYVTFTAEGSKDMMSLAMAGLVQDVYEMAGGGFSGSLTPAGRRQLFRNQVNQ